MKIVSWNVNGLRACVQHEKSIFGKADIYCFQEIKASEEQVKNVISPLLPSYHHVVFPAQKKGYAGVSMHTNILPMSVRLGIGNAEIDAEGRVITAEFDDFFLINAYFPHAHRTLSRLRYKMRFNQQFKEYCMRLGKPFIIAGDFNVAHTALDLKNPRQNEGNAGFTTEEREWFDGFLMQDLVDAFRLRCSDAGHYTWWPYAFNARERNIGWRIDYMVASKMLGEQIDNCEHLYSTFGSDHCPVILTIRKP